MKTIHKQVVCKQDLAYGVQDVVIPRNAEVISYGLQGGDICVWYEVDPDADAFRYNKHHLLFIAWTGEPIPPEHVLEFITTLVGRVFVHHLYFIKG